MISPPYLLLNKTFSFDGLLAFIHLGLADILSMQNPKLHLHESVCGKEIASRQNVQLQAAARFIRQTSKGRRKEVEISFPPVKFG